GDITGRLMLVPQAINDGFVAGTNAVQGATTARGDEVSPIGSFTDPEYAQVGLTEAQARKAHDVVVAVVHFDETTRTIIDGRTSGFCKLIADRATARSSSPGKLRGCAGAISIPTAPSATRPRRSASVEAAAPSSPATSRAAWLPRAAPASAKPTRRRGSA